MKLIPTLCLLYISTMTAIYGSVESFDSTSQLGVRASWEDFQARHIAATIPVNPQAWNQLLCDRIQTQFGTKTFNSFIASAVNVVADNFPDGVPQYTGGTRDNLYWSETSHHIFVLTLIGQPLQANPNYYVYDCGQRWFVAGLYERVNPRLPVHYQGHARTQGPRLDQITYGCARLPVSQPIRCRFTDDMSTNSLI